MAETLWEVFCTPGVMICISLMAVALAGVAVFAIIAWKVYKTQENMTIERKMASNRNWLMLTAYPPEWDMLNDIRDYFLKPYTPGDLQKHRGNKMFIYVCPNCGADIDVTEPETPVTCVCGGFWACLGWTTGYEDDEP